MHRLVPKQRKAEQSLEFIEVLEVGGRERIRTSGRLTPAPDFESGAFNHSATLPAVKSRLLSMDYALDRIWC
jgi:hypothetical protein